MLFLFLNLFLIVSIISLLLVLSMIWPPDSPWAPWWTTKPEIARRMCQLAKVNSKSIVYDLGCGTGTALIVACQEFKAVGVGIEIDPLRFLNAKINVARSGLQDRINLLRNNFFQVALSPATVLFIYLVPKALARLTPKFLREIKPGTIFVSFVYPMPQELFNQRLRLVRHDKTARIFVYQMLS